MHDQDSNQSMEEQDDFKKRSIVSSDIYKYQKE
jgi:hypothetical protein